MTSSRRRNQHDYRLIDVCFYKNLEIHVSYSILKKQKHSGFKEKYYYSDAVIMLKSSKSSTGSWMVASTKILKFMSAEVFLNR